MIGSIPAIVEATPLDLGTPELVTALVVSAVIFAFTGKKLREDIRRYFGV